MLIDLSAGEDQGREQTQADRLAAAVADFPDDWHRYLICADALLDDGHDGLAHAYRWMGLRRKRPFRRTHYHHPAAPPRAVPKKYGYAWYSSGAVARYCSVKAIPDHARLPRLVFLATGPIADHRLCDSWDRAVSLLAAGLMMLCDACDPNGTPCETPKEA